MSSVNIDLAADTILNVMVGQQDENEVREVVFDFSDWYTTYGSGTISLAIQRPKDEWPYEGTLTVDNSTHKATWEISDTDSAYAGVGQIQLSYTVGTAVKKSVVYRFTVHKSLGALGNVITPIQIQTFIDEVTEALEDMQEELNDVKQDLNKIGLIKIVKGSYQNDVWTTTGYSAFIPVLPGMKCAFTAPSNASSYVIGLKSVSFPISLGSPANFSDYMGWTSENAITKNTTFSNVIPNDVTYLNFYASLDTSYNRLPISIKIGEAEYRQELAKSVESVGNINNTIFKDDVSENIYKGSFQNNKWTNTGYTAFIKVNPGEDFVIKATTNVTYIAGYKSISVPAILNSAPDYSAYSGWTDEIAIRANQYYKGTIPDDVYYLGFYASFDTSYNRLPVSVVIDGIERRKSIYQNLSDAKIDIGSIEERTTAIPYERQVRTIGHGGYTQTYPFNSAMSYRDAKRVGFEWVETDIQFTSDNVPVLCHDDALYNYARNPDGTRIGTSMTDTVFISDITYDQLLYYDFGLAKSSSLAGTKITTFEQLMLIARNMGLNVQIEIKYNKNNSAPSSSQLDILFNLIDKYAMGKNVSFCSAIYSALEYIHSQKPLLEITYSVSQSFTQTDINNLLLLKGTNNVTIEAGLNVGSTQITLAKSANVPLGLYSFDTETQVINADPYVTLFTSNGPIAEEVLNNYEISLLPN